MKRTDLERKDRELKRAIKKQEVLERKGSKVDKTPGDFIKELSSLFFHDGTRIYNIDQSEEILILLEEIKDSAEEKHWENILRKAIKKTGIAQRDEAFSQLKELLDEL